MEGSFCGDNWASNNHVSAQISQTSLPYPDEHFIIFLYLPPVELWYEGLSDNLFKNLVVYVIFVDSKMIFS